MSHIQPVNLDTTGPVAPILDSIKKQMGSVPNIFATLAHSPNVLEGFLAFNGSLSSGVLSAQEREQIALAVAGINGCDYCASAHTILAVGAGIDRAETSINLSGTATDPRAQAILEFALSVTEQNGNISIDELDTLRTHGIGDEEIVEIVANVAINLFTNYFNHVAQTDIDFPLVTTQ